MTTPKWSFVEDVDEFYKAGIEGIGIWRRKLLDFGEERGAELLRDSGLSVSSLSLAGGFTGEHGESHRDAIRDALDAIKLAAEIRAASLVLVSGARSGHSLNHARRLVREALRELAPSAVRAGVQLVLQAPYSGDDRKWTFLDSLKDVRDLVRGCGLANVGLMLDVEQLAALSKEQPAKDGQPCADWLPWIKMVAIRNRAQLECLFPERYASGTPEVASPPMLVEFHRQNAQAFGEVCFQDCGHRDCDYLQVLKECSAAARCSTDIVVAPRAQADLHAPAETL